MAAIPMLLLHAKLMSTTGQIVDSLEMASVKALNSIATYQQAKKAPDGLKPETTEADKIEISPSPG